MRGKISTIVYCQRNGIEKIFEKLKSLGILAISIVDRVIWKRKAKDKHLRKQYLTLHQPDKLEIKTFQIIHRYGENLRTLVAQTKRKNRFQQRFESS